MKIGILNRMLVAVALSAAWLAGMSMPANAQGQGQQEYQQKQDKQQQKKERPQKFQKQQKQQQKGQAQVRQQQQRGQDKQQQQRAQQVKRQRQPRAVANNQGNHGDGNNGNHYSRIPDNSYRAHFGHDHSFRMIRPQMVEGCNRFQYSGYWLGFNQPWPAGWSYNDNVYVEYVGGGYYLYNPRHSGIRITLNLF